MRKQTQDWVQILQKTYPMEVYIYMCVYTLYMAGGTGEMVQLLRPLLLLQNTWFFHPEHPGPNNHM